MKKSLFVSAVTALTIVVGLVAVAQAQKDKQVIYVSSAQATYKPSPMGGVSMAALWGEMGKGPHATFTKFDPGYDAGMHTHTSDVWIVIKGAYLYIYRRRGRKARAPRRFPPSSRWPQALERR